MVTLAMGYLSALSGTTELLVGTAEGVFECHTDKHRPSESAYDADCLNLVKHCYSDFVLGGAKTSGATVRDGGKQCGSGTEQQHALPNRRRMGAEEDISEAACLPYARIHARLQRLCFAPDWPGNEDRTQQNVQAKDRGNSG